MQDFRLNGVSVGPMAVLPLKADVSVDAAKAAVKQDGLDEIVFEQAGKRYVAVGERLDVKGLPKGGVPTATLDGQPVIVLATDDEVTSAKESLQRHGKTVAIVAGVGVGLGALMAGGGYALGMSGHGLIGGIVNALTGTGMMLAGGGVAGAGLLGAAGVAGYQAVRAAQTQQDFQGLDQIVQHGE